MPLSYPEQKKFLGLFAQRNSFDLPDGAMEKALNIVMNDDDTVTKARGFYTYYDPTTDTLNAVTLYQDKLIAVLSDEMAYFTDTGSSPNETGTRNNLSGTTVAVTGTRVSRFLEQSGNLYSTTDNGIIKLDAYNGTLYQAGAPPGLDMRGQFLPENGALDGDSQAGYRVLFGRTDANDNDILGAPSDILVLTNSKVTGATYTSVPGFTVTVTSAGHSLSTGMSILVSGATDTDANGTHTVTVTSATQFTFTTVADPTSGTLDYTVSRTPLLEWSVPSDITSTTQNWFFQLYRTSQSGDDIVAPEADFRLVEQRYLTAGEITARVVFYQDDTDEVLVEFAPELYTNPNSREGEGQANARPPLAEDMDLFQGYAFYGNCRTRHLLPLDLIDAGSLASADYVEIKVDATTRRYVARTGVGNQTVRSASITNAGGDLQIDYTAHGLTNGDTVYISEITAGSLTAGTYFVVSFAANSFEISLTSGGASVAYSAVTSLYFQGVTNGTYPIFALDNSSLSVSTQLRVTAQSLVKAVNRDSSSLVYGNYISSIADTPGKMRFSAKGFTGTVYMRANTTTAGGAFAPVLPASFASGQQVASSSDTKRASIFLSKYGESEAVPLVNELIVGSTNKSILRVVALRDSVIVIKGDGVFKVTGDNPLNFNVTQLDNTIIAVAANSVSRLNNQVYLLATQGVCIATDSSVEIVSRRIENLIEPIVGLSTISAQTGSVGYDSDRTYRVSTIAPNETTRTITYVHNTLNDTWTQSDVLFKGGVVGPNDTLYLISNDDVLLKERKKGTRIDYCGQNYTVTVSSVAADSKSAVITSPNYAPSAGDALVKADVFTKFDTVTATSGTTFAVTFAKTSNIAAADSLPLYERIDSRVTMAPFHGGAIGRVKQVSQLQLRTRTNNVTRAYLSFQTQGFGGSELTTWRQSRIAVQGGWGFLPFGFFPFGLSDSINNIYTTQPATPIRIPVPRFAQRSSFIQLVLTHSEAGEPMEIQALCWTVRGYKERVSR